MLIRRGVANDHVLSCAGREMLVGGMGGIEAVTAVGVEGQTSGGGLIECVAQYRTVIDVAVIRGDGAGENGTVFCSIVCIDHSDRSIVGASHSDGQRRTAASPMLIRHGVADDHIL